MELTLRQQQSLITLLRDVERMRDTLEYARRRPHTLHPENPNMLVCDAAHDALDAVRRLEETLLKVIPE